VSGNLFSDTTVIDFPGAGTAWPENTTVKYTHATGQPEHHDHGNGRTEQRDPVSNPSAR
jgi:hypothetical protein